MPKRDENSPPRKKTPGSAKPGDKRAEMYTTPKARAEAVEKYREHLAAGMSKGTFLECDYRTVEKVIHDYSHEFPPGTIERFEKLSRHFWEKIGIMGTAGKIKGFSAGAWAINMRNRFAWDGDDPSGGDRPTVVVLNLGKELKPPLILDHQPKTTIQSEKQKVISPYDAE